MIHRAVPRVRFSVVAICRRRRIGREHLRLVFVPGENRSKDGSGSYEIEGFPRAMSKGVSCVFVGGGLDGVRVAAPELRGSAVVRTNSRVTELISPNALAFHTEWFQDHSRSSSLLSYILWTLIQEQLLYHHYHRQSCHQASRLVPEVRFRDTLREPAGDGICGNPYAFSVLDSN